MVDHNYDGMQTGYPHDVDASLRILAGYAEGGLKEGAELRIIAKALLHLGARVNALRERN